MQIHVEHSKIIATFETIEEKLVAMGGFPNPKDVKDNPFAFRVPLSVQNFRRAKQLGGHLAKDEKTVQAVSELKTEYQQYRKEAARIQKAKRGENLPEIPYDFCFNPYQHQRIGYYTMHVTSNLAIFGDCGIGKTALAASYLDSLKCLGKISPEMPAMIVCPISIIQHAWMEDLEKFTHHVKFISVYEPSSYKRAAKRLERLNTPCDIYVVSFSLLRIMTKELRHKRFKVIIVDESTKIKNAQSQTYRSLLQIAWKSQRRYAMSGTPAPNGPMDLWAQFFFLDRGLTLEPQFTDFRGQYFKEIQVNEGRQAFFVPESGTTEVINRLIEPRSVRFRAKDCLDLPDQTFMTRTVEMSSKQRQIYDDMADTLFAVTEEGESVTARVLVSKLMKLREITGGFVITDDEKHEAISGNPKLAELESLLEQIMETKGLETEEPTKAIIWIQYRWEAQTIIQKFRKKYGAAGLYGGISQKQKDKNINLFLHDSTKRILVCHPQSAAHGLTLTVATYAIYYSLSHNFEDYYQSSKRIYRSGQKRPVFYYFLVAERSVDQAILKCLIGKKNVQDVLIDGTIDPMVFAGGKHDVNKK